MRKKQKKSKSKSKKSKKETSKKPKKPKAELDEEKLKQVLEEIHPSEAELEELVDKEGFEQFMTSPDELWMPEPTTPILERVEGEQAPGPPIFLEQEVIEPPTIPGTEEHDPRKYLSSIEQEGPKYTDMSSMGIRPEGFDSEKVGTEMPQKAPERQEIFFKSDLDNSEASNIEKYVPAKRIDIDKTGREIPFEKTNKKYDFKLPDY
jgi:hypothetical protein